MAGRSLPEHQLDIHRRYRTFRVIRTFVGGSKSATAGFARGGQISGIGRLKMGRSIKQAASRGLGNIA
jgi:hypothetical protein